jgi:hypothetical protein
MSLLISGNLLSGYVDVVLSIVLRIVVDVAVVLIVVVSGYGATSCRCRRN